jgi:hypothetical protein
VALDVGDTNDDHRDAKQPRFDPRPAVPSKLTKHPARTRDVVVS